MLNKAAITTHQTPNEAKDPSLRLQERSSTSQQSRKTPLLFADEIAVRAHFGDLGQRAGQHDGLVMPFWEARLTRSSNQVIQNTHWQRHVSIDVRRPCAANHRRRLRMPARPMTILALRLRVEGGYAMRPHPIRKLMGWFVGYLRLHGLQHSEGHRCSRMSKIQCKHGTSGRSKEMG